MRHTMPTLANLAAALALALALLVGVLLPSDNAVHAAPPAFAAAEATREIPENTPPGVNIGDPISATDPDEDGADDDDYEFGETLTYSLEGADADSFNLDPLTGQLSTKAALDFEAHTDPATAYSVRVRVRDSRGETDTIVVTISVTDDTTEPPFAPVAPTVVSGRDDTTTTTDNESTTRLKVVWHPPENMGDRTITSYDYRYRRTTDPTWTEVTGVTTTTAEISTPPLAVNTTYLVSVRAISDEGTSPWSLSGTGSTNNTGNSPPVFSAVTNPSLPENSPAGQNVGLAVRASDSDTGALSYRLEGPDAAKFDFITSTGQIRTKRGVTYNREDPACGFVATAGSPTCTYYVTVAAYDGAGGSDAVRLEIGVNNQAEAPSAPAAPTVRATKGETTSLDVSWTPPANAGPPITSYNVQYRRRGSTDDFSSGGVPDTVAGASTTISGTDDSASPPGPWLARGTRYEVRVQAVNAEGSSLWSSLGTGSTNLGNLEPRFRLRPNSGDGSAPRSTFTIPLTIAESASPGSQVGTVAANDGNGDARIYRLSGGVPAAALALFDINESTGQIRTVSALNHEETACGYVDTDATTACTYTVTAEVRDGYDTDRERVEEAVDAPDDSVTVTISVRDVREPPAAPTVTVTSPTTVTTLDVTWDAPTNTGPPIASYDVEYRRSGAWLDDNCRGVTTDDNCDDIPATGTTTTITGLVVNTSYSVRVRATNAEGDSAWTTVTGRTNRNRAGSDPATPNTAPSDFDNTTSVSRSVAENTPSGQPVEGPISATVGDEDDRLAYSLEGPDRSSFTIDRNTGQIRTRVRLNHEDPACYDPDPDGVSGTDDSTCTYTVRVKVVDGQGGSATQPVTITVTDLAEPPSAPTPPRVTATKDSGLSLDVTWNEPRDTGKPPVTDYDIQYRLFRPSNEPQETFSAFDHTGTETSATITGLEPRTSYEVQVRAVNHEDRSDWSNTGRGTTGASNMRPTFEDTAAVVTLNMDENSRAGQDVGSPVSATDDDGDRLSYSLSGPDASSFDINRSSGRIRTRSGVSYDFESKSSYSLTVKVDDGRRKANSVTAKSVTVQLDNVDEPPSTPNAPRVTGVPGSTDSIRVSWDEPANTGPPITFYNLQYGPAGTGFVPLERNVVDRSTIITGLESGTRYEVQVRAHNGEGQSEYSRSGTGLPNADVANRNPRFTGGTRSFSVAEDTGAGEAVGDPVEAIDDDDDPLSYSLAGTDAASFDIDSVSGQIRTREALNFEEKSSHLVTVRARDNRGGSGTVDVRIAVTDVDEPPDTPDAPTVAALSSTSLQVSWDAPENTGPPITDYDYRYRGPTGDWTEVANTTITATTATIEGLTASTFYDVSVRAKNAEGTSDWSNSGFGSTNAPGANNPPVFTEGARATRTVSATSPPGTNIGEPVAATDADSGDTVTYRLEGRDMANFDIVAATGQLRTRTGVTLLVGETYTVTVVADDTKDTTRITVSIEATAAPPNIVPVFSEGTSATRTVNASAAAGTSIGAPVSATDADTGDTITYSLEGTDAASFDIVASSGQIQTKSGVTLTRTTYSVTVKATDSKGGSATITVTINVNLNAPPVFSEGASTTRSVVEPVAPFSDIGSPVAATDADGDTLTYSIEGTDRDSFFIDPSTGQLITRIELTVATKATYTVTVKATDSKGASATIAVTINVNAPPNAAPVFNEGSSATRSVREDASAGSSIGAPVTATDADNDTLTYSLEGTNASSFAIAATSGQLLTRSGVTLTANQAYTVTVVANDGRDSARITVTINVTVRRTYGCATSVAVSDESNTGLASDCEALLRARSILEGNVGRDDQLDWDLRDPIADWEGVFLSGSPQRVTAIVLRRRGLNGSVPADLGDLTMLTQLNLHSNNLRGNIPDEIGNLSNLQRLFLHNNSLSGDFPNLSRLRNLERLWLSGTNQRVGMGDGIPAWLNGLTNLQELNLWGNEIGGAIPNLSGLSNLKLLKLQNNSLTGTIPSWFGDMNGLSGLYLHANDLTGTIPASLGRNTGIVRLWLDRNDLSGSIPSELGNMSSLRTLNLRGNMLSGNIPPELGDLSRLQVLRLQDNRRVDDGGTVVSGGLTGAIPSELGDLGELLTLAASNNSLTGAIPPELGNLGKLRVLWLHNNGLTGAIPSALGNLGDTLTHIKLAGNSFATSACVPRALANVGSNDYSAAGLSICP